MDNIKKFEDFLDRMQGLLDNAKKQGHIIVRVEDLENTFPELQESEDERVRKTLIELVHDTTGDELWVDYNVHKEEALAWLEKQGEQKPTLDFKAKDWYISKVDGKIHNMTYNHADKVEPKFKAGDWITNGDYTWKIVEVKPLDYILQSQDGNIVDDTISHVDEQFHSFTIEDAKDGDVLATKKGNPFIYDKNRYNNGLAYYYAGLDVNKELTLKSPHHMLAHFGELRSVFPATKEQRDTLMKAMTDAGWEFDFDKKELKKISQRMVSAEAKEAMYDKPTDEEMKELLRTEYEKGRADAIAEMQKGWSEEDERICRAIVADIANDKSICKFEISKSICDEQINWLKSLKDRCTWKPSDGQMKALHNLNLTGNISYAGQGQELVELYNDLLKV